MLAAQPLPKSTSPEALRWYVGEALNDEYFQIVSNAAEYRRYAKVARKLAEQKQSSDRFMWAQLAQLWDKAADRMVAKEKADGKETPNGGEVHQP